MPSFGRRSRDNLATCDPQLQELLNEVIKYYDCSVTCGHRGQEDQMAARAEGRSKVAWPNSKHNSLPSKAVDVVPYPINWSDMERFYMFVGIVRGIAATKGIKIRCGADWDGDLTVKDQNFHDLPHIELILEE